MLPRHDVDVDCPQRVVLYVASLCLCNTLKSSPTFTVARAMDIHASTSYGALDVTVISATNIKTSSSLRILRLLCVVECAGARFKTKSKRGRSNPNWSQSGVLTFNRAIDADETIRVSVWDKRGDGHKCMGSAAFALRQLTRGAPETLALALEGGKYPDGRVTVRVKYTEGEMDSSRRLLAPAVEDARIEDTADIAKDYIADVQAFEAPSQGEDGVIEDSAEDAPEAMDASFDSDTGELLMVSTTMTPIDVPVDVAEEEEDEWSAVLKPSKNPVVDVPTSNDGTSAEVQKVMRDVMRKVHREVHNDNGRSAEIWAEESMDDIVVVTPPPMPAKPRDIHLAQENDDNASEARAQALNDLHTIRHVASPSAKVKNTPSNTPSTTAEAEIKIEAEAPLARNVDDEIVTVEHTPEQGKPTAKTTPQKAKIIPSAMKSPAITARAPPSPKKSPLRIESEEDLVAALLSPARLNSPRVTFDDRIARSVPVPSKVSTPLAQAPSSPKTASRVVAPPRTPPTLAKRLFDPPAQAAQPMMGDMIPTKSEIDEARRLALMFERADDVFASWSW